MVCDVMMSSVVMTESVSHDKVIADPSLGPEGRIRCYHR